MHTRREWKTSKEKSTLQFVQLQRSIKIKYTQRICALVAKPSLMLKGNIRKSAGPASAGASIIQCCPLFCFVLLKIRAWQTGSRIFSAANILCRWRCVSVCVCVSIALRLSNADLLIQNYSHHIIKLSIDRMTQTCRNMVWTRSPFFLLSLRFRFT